MPETVYRPLKELKKLPNNPRLIKGEDFRRLCQSVQNNPDYFEARPVILSDRTGELVIIAGNMRYQAAKHLKLKKVPTCLLSGLTEEREREIVIRDNVNNGEFDWDALANSWSDLPLAEWGVDLPEDWLEPKGGAEEDESAVAEMVDRAAELQKGWGTKLGQMWQISAHRLIVGDCTQKTILGRLCGEKRASLVVTSPPYNQKLDQFKPSGMHREHNWVSNVQKGSYFDSKPEADYQREQSEALRLWAEFLTPDGSIFYNHKNRYRDKCVVSPWAWLEVSGAKVRQEIIWKRPGSVTQNARMFLPCDERVFWLYFGDDFYFDDTTEHKTWSSVWEINPHIDAEESMHGCAFPVELALRPIKACSRPGDAVLEPYCGSGTTMVAAEKAGRVCLAAEISPQYSAVTLERMSALGLKPELMK